VDLSAKLEQWTKDSALAVADGAHYVYLVPSSVKQLARQQLTTIYGRQSVRYWLLAALVYLAVRDGLKK
jgi:hypothetical protein